MSNNTQSSFAQHKQLKEKSAPKYLAQSNDEKLSLMVDNENQSQKSLNLPPTTKEKVLYILNWLYTHQLIVHSSLILFGLFVFFGLFAFTLSVNWKGKHFLI